MDSIVAKLSEIEEAAAAIVDHAQDQKPILEREMQELRNRFDQELEQSTAEQLKKIQEDLEQEMNAVLEEQRAKSEEHIRVLNSNFEKNHTVYAKEILKRIIEV